MLKRDTSRLSWETSVERFYGPLYRFALSLSGSATKADELTCETYAHLARLGEGFRDRSQLKTWLFTALYREFVSQQLDSSKFRRQEFEPALGDLPSRNSSSHPRVDGDTVMSALQRVDEILRAPVTLFYLQELSYMEIAEILEVPLSTAMTRLSRGKQQLRSLLADADVLHDARENGRSFDPLLGGRFAA